MNQLSQTVYAVGFESEAQAYVLNQILHSSQVQRLIWCHTSDPLGCVDESIEVENIDLHKLLYRTPSKLQNQYFGRRLWEEINSFDHSFYDELAMIERFRFHVPMIQTIDSPHDTARLVMQIRSWWVAKIAIDKPRFALFSRIPHDAADFIGYNKLKKAQIPTAVIESLPIVTTYYITEDIRKPVVGEDETQINRRSSEVNSLPERLSEEYRLQCDQVVPPYAIRPTIHDSLRRKSRELRDRGAKSYMSAITGGELGLEAPLYASRWIERTLVSRVRSSQEDKKRVKTAAEVVERALGRKIVYVPLHRRPEMKISPLGGIFADQLLMIEALNELAEEFGFVIAVKPNPLQLRHFEPKNFWKNIEMMAHIIPVSMNCRSQDLIGISDLVATITGTAGWEALFLGKPVLVFGYAFYRGAPGVFEVPGPDALAGVVDAAFRFTESRSPEPRHSLVKFMAALADATFTGSWSPYRQRIQNHGVDMENRIRMAQDIDLALRTRGFLGG